MRDYKQEYIDSVDGAAHNSAVEIIKQLQAENARLKWGCENALKVLERICDKCPQGNKCVGGKSTENCKTLMMISNIRESLQGKKGSD